MPLSAQPTNFEICAARAERDNAVRTVMGGAKAPLSPQALSHYRKLHAMDISLRDIMPQRRLRAMSASPRPERLDWTLNVL
jgi:hypothetical protein